MNFTCQAQILGLHLPSAKAKSPPLSCPSRCSRSQLAGTLTKYGLAAPVAARPSEAVEFYMYFFSFAYLLVVERRIHALAAESRGDGTEG